MDNCIICCEGESIINFNPPENIVLIGCNAVEKYFLVDYLVVVNEEPTFPLERWNYIKNTNSVVYSHLNLNVKNLIKFELGTPELNLEDEKYSFSTTSPYMAIIHAYKMGFKNIYIIGVDFINHKLSHRLERINEDYTNLYSELQKKGVNLWNLSERSLLTTIPKISLETFATL